MIERRNSVDRATIAAVILAADRVAESYACSSGAAESMAYEVLFRFVDELRRVADDGEGSE